MPTQQPNREKTPAFVEARALRDFYNGDAFVIAGTFCKVPGGIADALRKAGTIDTHKSAVDYAKGIA